MRSFKFNLTTKILFIIFSLIFFYPSFAARYESMDHIKDVAKQFILKSVQVDSGDSMEVQVNPVNSELDVHACAKELAASYPRDSNREQTSSVELTCNDPQPWHILVPVDIQIFTNVVIAKRTLPPKQEITEDDLDFTVFNKNRLYNGYFSRKEDVIGNEAAHLITAGTILTKKNLQLPVIIKRNQVISITAQSNAVIVTMEGVAKTDGSLNSTIQVFNPSSKRILDAIVTGPNKAQIVS